MNTVGAPSRRDRVMYAVRNRAGDGAPTKIIAVMNTVGAPSRRDRVMYAVRNRAEDGAPT